MKQGDLVRPSSIMGRQCRRRLQMDPDKIFDPNSDFSVYVPIDAIMLVIEVPEPEVHAFIHVLHSEHGLLWAAKRQVEVVNAAG
jgi:hypothetical protein